MKVIATTLLLLLLKFSKSDEELEAPQVELNAFVSTATKHACHENGVVASWCNSKVNPALECSIHPTLNLYACKCEQDPSACPDECVNGDGHNMVKTHYGIQCGGIPQDEPNYILKERNPVKEQHHCENNAVVANWCNEQTTPGVSCLLLSSLDEYVCTCHDNAAACPRECVGGTAPDKKTKHGIRCKNIPLDQPNYVLKA